MYVRRYMSRDISEAPVAPPRGRLGLRPRGELSRRVCHTCGRQDLQNGRRPRHRREVPWRGLSVHSFDFYYLVHLLLTCAMVKQQLILFIVWYGDTQFWKQFPFFILNSLINSHNIHIYKKTANSFLQTYRLQINSHRWNRQRHKIPDFIETHKLLNIPSKYVKN